MEARNESAPIDGELAARAAGGDRDAFSLLVQRHHHLVAAIVGRSDLPAGDRDDARQDIWLQAWLAIPRIKAPENFSAWLQGVARNVLGRRRLGRVRWDRALRAAGEDAPRDMGPVSTGTVATTPGFEDLSARHQDLLRRKYDGRQSYIQITAATGSTTAAVRSSLFRARRRLALNTFHSGRRRKQMTRATVTGIDLLEYEFNDEARVVAHVRFSTTMGEPLLGMVWDGAAARAAAAALHEIVGDRPHTHDLTLSLIERLGGRVESVSIDRLEGDVYYGTVHVAAGEKRLEVDARPSDAIVLAIRAGAEIQVSPAATNQVGSNASIPTLEDLDSYQGERGGLQISKESLWPAPPPPSPPPSQA